MFSFDNDICHSGWSVSVDALETGYSFDNVHYMVQRLSPNSAYPIGLSCQNLRNVATENIGQDGFYPTFECLPTVGYKCNQKAPCHPCPFITLQVWYSCILDVAWTNSLPLVDMAPSSVAIRNPGLVR